MKRLASFEKMADESHLGAGEAGQAGTREVKAAPWESQIPLEQWTVYERVLRRAEAEGIRFVLGGGLAFSHYSERWRNTKDLDLYVAPAEKDRLVAVTREAGLRDYFEVLPYDRKWIYRSHNGEGIIVDLIWQMANYRAQVDENWLTKGDVVSIHGHALRLLAAEELFWAKLYVLQRDRCDWGDLLNIVYGQGPTMDWERIVRNAGEDVRVVAAVLELFAWSCPGRARELPASLWKRLRIAPPERRAEVPEKDDEHIRLLDSRDWFGPTS